MAFSTYSVAVCLAASWLLHVSASEFERPRDPELQLTIARCRADCLDEFDGSMPSELSCPDCFMCWESCALLHNDFNIWGPMCQASDICFPGCRRACSFHSSQGQSAATSDLPSENDWVFPSTVHSTYEPKIDCIRLEWAAPVSSTHRNLAKILYSVMLRNRLVQVEPQWEQISQTFHRNMTVKRGLLNSATDIKIVAVTSGGPLAEIVSPFLDTNYPFPMVADDAGAVDRTANKVAPSADSIWRIRLMSLQNSRKSVGVEATVTWPARWPERFVKYEVSWKVIDDTMEITGHLYTVTSVAVLTLWPDALYSVQIRCFSRRGEELAVSEALLVNTRGLEAAAASSTAKCSECIPTEIIAGAAAGIFFLVLLVFITCLCHRCKSPEKTIVLQEGSLPTDSKAMRIGKSTGCSSKAHPKVVSKKSSGATIGSISQSREDLIEDSFVQPYLTYDLPPSFHVNCTSPVCGV